MDCWRKKLEKEDGENAIFSTAGFRMWVTVHCATKADLGAKVLVEHGGEGLPFSSYFHFCNVLHI